MTLPFVLYSLLYEMGSGFFMVLSILFASFVRLKATLTQRLGYVISHKFSSDFNSLDIGRNKMTISFIQYLF
jgi:hypothetical protein